MIFNLLRRRKPDSSSALSYVIVPVPALVDVLEKLEAAKGAPLIEAEVLQARDRCVCVRVSASEAAALIASERFHIDLAWPYADWCRYRRGAASPARPTKGPVLRHAAVQ